MTRPISITFLMFIIPRLLAAQTINVTGAVIDSTTQQPVAGAQVRLVEFPQVVTSTAANGSFTLAGTATAMIRRGTRATPAAEFVLTGNQLRIAGLQGPTSVVIDAFSLNGTRNFHKIATPNAAGMVHLGQQWSAAGYHFIRVCLGGATYSTTTLRGSRRLLFSSDAKPALAKIAAAYTLQVTDSGYIARQVTLGSTTTAAGTIKILKSPVEAGVWQRVSVPGGQRYAQSLVNDPARPSDFYSFSSSGQGGSLTVARSTDFGASWRVINTGAMTGLPWGNAIDPNPDRDPATAPTLYACSGYGRQGLWKSTDWGVNWTQLLTMPTIFDSYGIGATPDVYSVTVLPDNTPNHLLISFHGYWVGYPDGGLGESFDGGATWVAHLPAAGMGQSEYVMVVDKDTWITVGQWESNRQGTWRTTTAGRVNGTISTAAWTQVSMCEHGHGMFQGYVDPVNHAVYNAGTAGSSYGIFRSTNAGATWTNVLAGDASHLVATDKYIYSNYLLGPNLLRTPRTNGETWSTYGTTPSGMTGEIGPGAATHASSTDGKTWYVLAAINDGGVWRYIEP